MTFQQLQHLLAVHRTGSFSLAAKEMFVSQSAVSNAISGLEQELGCRIFVSLYYPLHLLYLKNLNYKIYLVPNCYLHRSHLYLKEFDIGIFHNIS